MFLSADNHVQNVEMYIFTRNLVDNASYITKVKLKTNEGSVDLRILLQTNFSFFLQECF